MIFLAHEEFQKFVELIKGMTSDKVIRAAEHEHARGDRPSRRDPFREQKLKYRALMGGFLFWMHHGARPGGLSDAEFATFRPICEDLVNNKQLKPEALDMFGPKG